MNLDVQTWMPFCIERLFAVEPGKYYYSYEYDEGSTPYCSASAENNGVGKKIDLSPDFTGNKIITGKVGCTSFYEPLPFCATSDVNVLVPRFEMSSFAGLFITTIINKSENYRWNYGRQCRVGNTKRIVIKLPIKRDKMGLPIYDEEKTFSDDGYIPDWAFMEEYINSLHYKPITTKTGSGSVSLTQQFIVWQPFFLHRIFYVGMGNGIDAILTTNYNPKYNYVSRDSNGNGVVGFVDEIEGEEPFPAGGMSLALGGSFLGACFIQRKPFYTAQNVGVLQEKVPLSDYTKLFIATLIRNECKVKFQAFGRELNSHFRKDFILKLPIQYKDGKPIIDKTKTFSDDGFVPDWQWMEDYIKSLPFGDRI